MKQCEADSFVSRFCVWSMLYEKIGDRYFDKKYYKGIIMWIYHSYDIRIHKRYRKME